jgi:hypothetical protein
VSSNTLWMGQVELVINIIATFFIEFVSDAWNWFDFVVVLVSLLSLGMENLPGAQVIHVCVCVFHRPPQKMLRLCTYALHVRMRASMYMRISICMHA